MLLGFLIGTSRNNRMPDVSTGRPHGKWIVFLLVCRGSGNRADLGGVHGTESRLGHYDVEFGVPEWADCCTDSDSGRGFDNGEETESSD
jgi:hypothetical protein